MEAFVLILFFSSIVVCFLGSLVWIHRDAEFRGKSGPLVVFLMIVLGWPVTLLVWLALRPPPPNPMGGRRPFNLEDFRRQ